MRKFQVMAVLFGTMLMMAGCGASSETAADSISESAVQDTMAVETQSELETEMKSEAGVDSETETASTVAETEPETASMTAGPEPETASPAAETETEMETASTAAETEMETASMASETETETASPAAGTESVKETVQAATEPVPAAEGSVSSEDYAAVVSGHIIPLGGDMRDYVGLLGGPDEYGSARSCTEAGEDKVYTYGGTMIYTYVTNGADIISLIEITGSESLPSGIHIGSTKEEVIAAYGSGYTEDGTELLYETGNKTIGLQMTDNKVSFIELFGQ